jgi:hypothetical protein
MSICKLVKELGLASKLSWEPDPGVVRTGHQVGQGVAKAGCKALPSAKKVIDIFWIRLLDGEGITMILDELLSQSISETASERSRILADLFGAHYHASRNQR